jgi:hypothetical protein
VKRILMFLAVALVVAAIVVLTAAPALAVPPEEDQGEGFGPCEASCGYHFGEEDPQFDKKNEPKGEGFGVKK